jgi:hypothetical protein
MKIVIHHRDTESTEEAQRNNSSFCVTSVSSVVSLNAPHTQLSKINHYSRALRDLTVQTDFREILGKHREGSAGHLIAREHYTRKS